jgi:hypothetical protein
MMSLQKLISLRFSLCWLSLALTPITTLAASDNGTLSVGRRSITLWGCTITYSGYNSPIGSMGSYSPTGLTGEKTVAELLDIVSSCGTINAVIQVNGFSSDPGSAWLTSVTCRGVTLSTSASYVYSSGTASWNWVNNLFGLYADSVGTNVSCTIVHS